MEWWSTQSVEAQDAAFDPVGRISILELTNQLNRYLVGVDKIWAQGPLFDIPIMESIYIAAGKSAPWQYWQIRDSRTIGDMGDYSAKTDNKSAHNALADAYSQALGVQQIYHQLGVKKK
jgi:exodeoxyribonuclease VIII